MDFAIHTKLSNKPSLMRIDICDLPHCPDKLQSGPSYFSSHIHEDVQRLRNTLWSSAHMLFSRNQRGRLDLSGSTANWVSHRATPQNARKVLLRCKGVVIDITQNKSGELGAGRSREKRRKVAGTPVTQAALYGPPGAERAAAEFPQHAFFGSALP